MDATQGHANRTHLPAFRTARGRHAVSARTKSARPLRYRDRVRCVHAATFDGRVDTSTAAPTHASRRVYTRRD
eukprot:5237031-Prymnesium_polylepis.1